MAAIMEGTRYAQSRYFRSAAGERPVVYFYRDSNIPGIIRLYLEDSLQTLQGAGFNVGASITYVKGTRKLTAVISQINQGDGVINKKTFKTIITIPYTGPAIDSAYDGVVYLTANEALAPTPVNAALDSSTLLPGSPDDEIQDTATAEKDTSGIIRSLVWISIGVIIAALIVKRIFKKSK